MSDRSSYIELGKGVIDIPRIIAAIPNISQKPLYVEQEGPADELASVKQDFEYLKKLS